MQNQMKPLNSGSHLWTNITDPSKRQEATEFAFSWEKRKWYLVQFTQEMVHHVEARFVCSIAIKLHSQLKFFQTFKQIQPLFIGHFWRVAFKVRLSAKPFIWK